VSGSLYGMQGMGSGGGGMSPAMGSIPPQLMQLLMQHAGGMGGAMTPGAAMMSGPQLAAGMQHPQMPNPTAMMGAPQQPQQMPNQLSSLMQPGAGGAPSPIMGLLAALKGQQSGLTPQQPASAFGASGALPAWLQALLGGGAPMPQGVAGPGGTLGGPT